jgi:lipopolysaccharide assembly protein A
MEGAMRIISFIIAIILILIGLSFALLNAAPVNLNYYVGTVTLSLSLLLILTLGVGIIIGLLALLAPIFKLKRRNHRLSVRVRQLEQEILAARVPETKDQ